MGGSQAPRSHIDHVLFIHVKVPKNRERSYSHLLNPGRAEKHLDTFYLDTILLPRAGGGGGIYTFLDSN